MALSSGHVDPFPVTPKREQAQAVGMPSPAFLFAFSSSSHTGGLKRKGVPNKKEPQKRRKVSKPSLPSEDLLVAMALSRSEMEQCPAVPALSLESAFSERMRPGAGVRLGAGPGDLAAAPGLSYLWVGTSR